jgi:hypothetical protein
MVVGEAVELLKRPIFADAQCIQAKGVVSLARQLKDAREAADLNPLYDAPVHSMDADQLRDELERWRELGCGEEC